MKDTVKLQRAESNEEEEEEETKTENEKDAEIEVTLPGGFVTILAELTYCVATFNAAICLKFFQ